MPVDPPTLVHLPSLPPLLEPPRLGPDPRQRRFAAILAGLANSLGDAIELSTSNIAAGYPAAAVDLGRLKFELERGLERFDMALVRARWDVDVRDWLTRCIFAWVQRVRSLHLAPGELGVAVRFETQDDVGYYDYGFDAMPGRRDGDGSNPASA